MKRIKAAANIAKVVVMLGSAAYLAVGIAQFDAIEDEPKIISSTVMAAPADGLEVAGEEPKIETTEEQVELSQSSIIQSRDWDADEAYLLAKIAMAEAEGEDVEGKALVITVVLNRVWSDEFPKTIEEVIYQENQFAPISNGRWDKVEPDQECYEALGMVEMGWDESQGATYFESRNDSDWHQNNLEFLFQHGGHYFYRDKED